MKLRFQTALNNTEPFSAFMLQPTPVTSIYEVTNSEFSEKDIKKILEQNSSNINSASSLGQSFKIDVQYKGEHILFVVGCNVGRSTLHGAIYNEHFCRSFVYGDYIVRNQKWETYNIHAFSLPLDRDQFKPGLPIKNEGLASAESTQEALRLFLIGNGSENTLADEIPYASGLFDHQLKLDLLLKDDEPQTVIKVLETVKNKSLLTEEEIIDLKVAFFQIADAIKDKPSAELTELHTRAFQL